MQNIIKFTGIYTESLNLNSGRTRDNEEWNALDIVIEETDVQYPQQVTANIFGAGKYADKVEKFLDYNSIGDEVEVELRFSVNEGKDGRKYNKIQAWNIKNLTRKAKAHQKIKETAVASKKMDKQMDEAAEGNIDDDLPF